MRAVVGAAVLWSVVAQGLAADEAGKADAPAEPKAQEPSPPVQTHHTIVLDGRELAYTATAGTVEVRAEDGTDKASVFYVAYVLDGADPATRPVTFTFNGGPGSSSVWLHLGAFGPRRVAMDDVGRPLGPPYHLDDNEACLLDLTDLVFIDPVTTGYSRAAKGEDPAQFHGVEQDIESVGEVIRLYTTQQQRWASPKFLAGESYGTTRAAGLAGYLQERHGMYLNGVILVSSVLNFLTARFDPGNDLAHVLLLPTCTATAWYHHRLAPDLQRDLRRTLAEVESFAVNEYALALLQGSDLPDDRRRDIADRVARYTGLSPDYVLQSNLRLSTGRFTKELLRDQRRTVGRLDSRFLGIDADAAGEGVDYDPSYAAIQGPFTAMLNAYVRGDLGYHNDLTYEILTGRVHPWSFNGIENRYLNVAATLRDAMTRNRNLRVFVASGYYDMATPYFATDYTLRHLDLDPTLRDHVSVDYFESGHMMYIHQPSRGRLKADLADFYARASAPPPPPPAPAAP